MRDLFVTYFHELTDGIPQYVYEALLSVFCLTSILLLIICGIKRGWRKVVLTLLLEYSFLLYGSTVFFRKTNVDLRFELQPLWTYGAISEGVNNMIPKTVMNIFVFIPIGIMMGLVFKSAKWWKIIVAAVSMSVTIELLQLLFKKGCCETDDVIHNTLGCAIGYGVYCMLRTVRNKVIYSKR